jgi:hypothetical protein
VPLIDVSRHCVSGQKHFHRGSLSLRNISPTFLARDPSPFHPRWLANVFADSSIDAPIATPLSQQQEDINGDRATRSVASDRT